MLEIKTWRDPYDACFTPTHPKQVSFTSGLTVLVGCNGAGKTTLLRNIESEATKNNIPVHRYDNLRDGGSTNVLDSVISGFKGMECDDMSLGVNIWTASEGEAIKLNLGRQSTLYKEFVQSGFFKDKKYRFHNIFSEVADSSMSDNRRILLFDAADSGMSIDNVIEIKSLFDLVINDASEKGKEMYIIISANEFELCRNCNCFDVNSGKYLTFKDYEDYRRFILNSRKRKEKRIKQQFDRKEKKRQTELNKLAKLKEQCNRQKQKIIDKAKSNGRELNWGEKAKLEYFDRRISDFVYESSYLTEEDIRDDTSKCN